MQAEMAMAWHLFRTPQTFWTRWILERRLRLGKQIECSSEGWSVYSCTYYHGLSQP